MSDPRYARVRHILVEEKGEEGRSKLEEAKEEIAGDLDKFSEVAEKMSTCTSAVSRANLSAAGQCWILCWIMEPPRTHSLAAILEIERGVTWAQLNRTAVTTSRSPRRRDPV